MPACRVVSTFVLRHEPIDAKLRDDEFAHLSRFLQKSQYYLRIGPGLDRRVVNFV